MLKNSQLQALDYIYSMQNDNTVVGHRKLAKSLKALGVDPVDLIEYVLHNTSKSHS